MKSILHIREKIKAAIRHRTIKKDIVLVYTMGKVGSSTIYAALKRALPKSLIFQPHFLSNYYLNEILPTTNHYVANKKVADEVFKYFKIHKNKRIKIITLVRDPIDRDISNMFENPVDFIGSEDINNISVNELIDIYKSKEKHSYTLNWFDDEFFNYTGVDVYYLDFNTSKAFQIYKLAKFDLLIIKMERLDEVATVALNKFVNIKINTPRRENTGKSKKSNQIANCFKTKYRPDKEELERVYTSKLVQHFYNSNEIEEFKNMHLKH